MKLFIQWAKLHPFKLICLVAYSALCGVVWESFDATIGMLMAVLGYGAWSLVYIIDSNKLLCLLVALSMLSNAPRAKAAPLVVGAILIVVVGGGAIIGCKVVKKCSKIAGNRDRQLTNESPFRVAGAPYEYGALFAWSEPGYCAAERLLPVAPTVFTLNISVESVSNATVTCTASTGFEFVQSWESFMEELAGHGLAVTAGLNHSSYERNRHPVHAEQVPIAFNFATRTATVGRGGILVTIERTDDLTTWEPLMKMDVEPGTPLRIEDVGSEQCFFRIQLSKP